MPYFNYSYEKIEKGTNQYADVLGESNIVDAKYVRTVTSQGNPFIEALPRYLTVEQVADEYTHTIPIPTSDQLQTMDLYEIMESISLLKQFRIPLSFNGNVEEAFHNALVTSYKNRKPLRDNDVGIPIRIGRNDTEVHQKLVATCLSASVTGFALLGTSGCGKSTCIGTLISHYPQVIRHKPNKDEQIIQIVYLVIVCPSCSNFSSLYIEVGRQIDEALGYLLPVYQNMIAAKKTLGAKAAAVRDLIELFNIGIILFDEIQELSVGGSRENTVESLLTLNNQTNCAFAVIGTEDAFLKLCSVQRVSRRFQPFIFASRYCENKTVFGRLVDTLFDMSWTGEIYQATTEIKDCLYDITGGVIDKLIRCYSYLQSDMVKAQRRKGETPVMSVKFIKDSASKHSLIIDEHKGQHLVQEIIHNNKEKRMSASVVNSPETDALLRENEAELEDILTQKRDEAQLFLQAERIEIALYPQYSETRIRKAATKVLNDPLHQNIPDEEAIALVKQLLDEEDLESVKKKEAKARRLPAAEIADIVTNTSEDLRP